jgi:hypothetical protein
MTQRFLRTGVFLAPFHPLAENPLLALDRDMDLLIHLDRLNYHEAWIGEHHSGGFEIIACPEMFIAVAAERTRHIRLGTGVVSLPYHNPFTVAGRLIEARWAEGNYGRLPAMVEELIGRHVALICTTGGLDPVRTAQTATATIPIVFVIGGDPVKFGLVESLNHPGGNLTGIGLLAYLLEAKRLELVHEQVPRASKVAVPVNPTNSETESGLLDLQAAAPRVGQQLIVLNARSETDIGTAFTTLQQQQAEALVVSPDPFLLSRHGQIVELAARLAVPAVYAWRDFVDA